MIIKINVRKVVNFARRHKEAIAITCIAVAVTHRMRNEHKSMEMFIVSNNLTDIYCETIQK